MRASPLLCAAAAAAALLGCCTVETASSPLLGEGVRSHVHVQNYGWYLFGAVPLAVGNDDEESFFPTIFFCDTVTAEKTYARLLREAEREGCAVRDPHLVRDNDVMFDAWYFPVPWILVCKEVQVSAMLEEGRAQ